MQSGAKVKVGFQREKDTRSGGKGYLNEGAVKENRLRQTLW